MCTYFKSQFDVPPTQPLLCSRWSCFIIVFKDTLLFFDSLVPHVTGVLFCHRFHCEFKFSGPYSMVWYSKANEILHFLIFHYVRLSCFCALLTRNNETNWWSWNVCTTPVWFVCICHCGMLSNTENPLLASCIHFQKWEEENQCENKQYVDV